MVNRFFFILLTITSFACKVGVNGSKLILMEESLSPIVTTKLDKDSIPTARIFTFDDKISFSVMFNFDSTAESCFSSEEARIGFVNLFYSHPESRNISRYYYKEKFESDSTFFFTDQDQLIFSNYYKIYFSKKMFVLIEFRKHKMDIMPIDKSLYLLIDVSNPKRLNGIGFLSINIDDDLKQQIFIDNNRLSIKCKYWKSKINLGNFLIYQNSSCKWKIR